MVVPVPDSGVPAALGYAQGSGIPFELGIIRNHYVGRTFIEPTQEMRNIKVKMKLNPMRSLIEGKSLIVIDDSIVRGTTSKRIVQMLKEAGAKEVHFRVASPMIQHPCFYGIDTPTKEELINATMSKEEVREYIGADSLEYLSLDNLKDALGHERNYSMVSFDGDYCIGRQFYLKQLLTLGKYFKNKFGEKVYKIPISISGFTCPNIDGTVAKGGCTFCENESFSPNLTDKSKFKLNLNSTENPYLDKQLLQLEAQFNLTKERLQNKFGAKKFIVYFQSFTNTYAPLDTLKALYEKALEFENVVGLSIGTRTDSITEESLDYIASLSTRKLPKYLLNEKMTTDRYDIWVEYGIQSIFDETLIKLKKQKIEIYQFVVI